jgi:acetyl esterase/lipase
MDSDSYREFADGRAGREGHGAVLSPTSTARMAPSPTLAGERRRSGRRAPAYIAVAGHDVLRDDGLRYAEPAARPASR